MGKAQEQAIYKKEIQVVNKIGIFFKKAFNLI